MYRSVTIWMLEIVIQEVLWSIWGSFSAIWSTLSRILNDILILDQQWLPNQSDFPPISWPSYRAWPSPIMSGFHGAFATGVACQQGTLTTPDTLFCPFCGGLHVLWLLRPVSQTLHRFNDLPKLTHRNERIPSSICDGCGMPAGSAYPSGHLVPSPIVGLACAPIVETRFLELPCLYSTFHLEYSLVLSRLC